LSSVADPLTRQLVVLDMIRDNNISTIEFLEFMIEQILSEVSCIIANYELEMSINLLKYKVPAGYIKEQLSHQLFIAVFSKILTADAESATIYQNMIQSFIYHPDDIALAISWVSNNDTTAANWKLSQQDRWNIIKIFSTISKQAKIYVESEYEADPSDTGYLAKLYCEAAYPDIESKAKTWQMLISSGESLSRYERKEVMEGFNIGRQSEILNQYGDYFFNEILNQLATTDKEYSKDFCEYLVPYYWIEEAVIEKLEEIIQKIPQDRFEITRSFRERIEFLMCLSMELDSSVNYIKSFI